MKLGIQPNIGGNVSNKSLSSRGSSPSTPITIPSDLANLTLWWDITDTGTTTDTLGVLNTVTDKSGNTRTGTADGKGGAAATLNTDGNGLQYLDMTISADNWVNTSVVQNFTGDFTFCLFIANLAVNAFNVVYSGFSVFDVARPVSNFYRINGTTISLDSTSAGYSGLLAWRRSSNTNVVYQNGALGATEVVQDGTMDIFGLGLRNSTNNSSPVGEVYGFATYDRALTLSELNNLNTYATTTLQL